MTSVRELARNLSEEIGAAAAMAPNEYDPEGYTTYENNMADIREFLAQIKPKLKHDAGRSDLIEKQVVAMIEAFDTGDKKLGRKIAWDLWNLPIRNLK